MSTSNGGDGAGQSAATGKVNATADLYDPPNHDDLGVTNVVKLVRVSRAVVGDDNHTVAGSDTSTLQVIDIQQRTLATTTKGEFARKVMGRLRIQ